MDIYVFDFFLIPTVGSSSEILVKIFSFKVLFLLLVVSVFEKAVNGSGGILWEEEDETLHKGGTVASLGHRA